MPPTDAPRTHAPPAPRTHSRRARVLASIAAVLLLAFQAAILVDATFRDNMTVDEPVHMAAGVSYWQTGTFRNYHHSPPLARLLAAAPVLLFGQPKTDGLYERGDWSWRQAEFAHKFADLNRERYFEYGRLARLVTPAFAFLGGLAVFLWSLRVFGPAGALVSVSLWTFCPNILAHGRLVTTDVPSIALATAATLVFLVSLDRQRLAWSVAAGVALGLATLVKFSVLQLYLVWPLLWLLRRQLPDPSRPPRAPLPRALGRGAALLLAAILVINLGYLFEGFGKPLGSFEFLSRTLTRDRTPDDGRPPLSHVPDFQIVYAKKVNRFRNTWLGALPAPLPAEFVSGFDEQKFEAEGFPLHLADPDAPPDAVAGYPVYLDGELRDSGWRSYYLRAFLYKTPETTLLLLALAAILYAANPRRSGFAPLYAAVPALAALLAMTFGTDINIGLRYVLGVFPFLHILAGRIGPWIEDAPALTGRALRAALPLAAIAGTAYASLAIHPHHLAYFNTLAGGPDRGSERLIDSNLDWGQDLVNLQAWAAENIPPGETLRLAYFGQIHPDILAARGPGLGLDWKLPPARPGSLRPLRPSFREPRHPLPPGWYAISASLVRGLPWRVYDPDADPVFPSWSAGKHAWSAFATLQPVAKVGYSIFVYRLDPDDAAAVEARWRENPDPANPDLPR